MTDEQAVIYLDDRECLIDTRHGTFAIRERGEVEQLRQWVENAERSGKQTAFVLSAAARACLSEAKGLGPLDDPRIPSIWRLAGTRLKRNVIADLPRIDFDAVIRLRESRRLFSPPSIEDVLTTLTYSARVRAARRLDDGFDWTSRPAPSAGGCHPIELFVCVDRALKLEPGIYWFDPFVCKLDRMPADHSQHVLELSERARGIVGANEAPVTFLLMADFERSLSRYRAPISLVLRDAGALLATISFVAASLGLSSCIVGTCGDTQLNSVLDLEYPRWVEVGALILGRPDSTD